MGSERPKSTASAPRIDTNDSSITLLAEPTAPCRVLIVDDDPHVVLRISSLLGSGKNYEILTAATGEEALRILDTQPCQIVLTDWHMPDMDGLALCRNLRLRQIDGYVYILMLTVRDSTDDVLAGLAAGADDYLVKGAASAEILARIEVGRRTTNLERSLRKSNEANRRMAITDPLTGVHNRRFLMKYLPKEMERSRRFNHPLAVISCDLDNFKGINDCFGHDVGDEILQAFAATAGSCLRQNIDWIARSGGEEFLIVLPETSLRGATTAAARLREALAASPVSTSSGPLAVTVSMGVTSLETPRELLEVTVTELLRAADRYLLQSKQQGKDRATVAGVDALKVQNGKQSGERHGAH
jgi:diguanylate cyclase (GGDEF)-like protein